MHLFYIEAPELALKLLNLTKRRPQSISSSGERSNEQNRRCGAHRITGCMKRFLTYGIRWGDFFFLFFLPIPSKKKKNISTHPYLAGLGDSGDNQSIYNDKILMPQQYESKKMNTQAEG